MPEYGPFKAVVDKVVDGDTIHMRLDIGFDITIYGRCRVYGINAPEVRTASGQTAKLFAQSLLSPGDEVSVVSHSWDKYGGRFDGTITLSDGTNFATAMLDAGFAVRL